MKTVAANVQLLTSWNRSMAVALEKAERGSQAEDMYFIEKLEKTADALGFVLDTAPAEELKEPPVSPSEQAMSTNEKLVEQAKTETICKGCGEPKDVGMIVCWECFKYRTDITSLKYYEGTFAGWLETTKELTEKPSEFVGQTLAQFLAEFIDRHEYKAQAGEVGALEEVIAEGILAHESTEGVTVKVVR